MMFHDVYFKGYYIASYWGNMDMPDLDVLVAIGINLDSFDFKDFKVMPGCFCH